MKLKQEHWLAAIGIVAVLAGLFGWQRHRARLVAGCVTVGGLWDGRTSQCLPPRPSPILQRDLRRT